MGRRREPTSSLPVEQTLGEGHADYIPPKGSGPEPLHMELKLKPVVMETPTSEGVLNNLIVRELNDPTGPTEPLSPTIGVLQRLIEGLTFGTDLSGIKDEVLRIVQHQPEKADLFNALISMINQERVVDAVITRGQTEKLIKRAANRGDLTTTEALVVWRLCNNVIQEAQQNNGKSKSMDSVAVVEKVDYARQKSENKHSTRWENTTPTGREIMRKKLYDLRREIEEGKSS